MRRIFMIVLAALMPVGLLRAEPAPISAEIAENGIAAVEARLSALENPAAPELFALAGLRFLSGVESALQLRWQTGAAADWSELPILRLPIPANPAPRALEGADIERLLSGLGADMEAARVALEALGERDFALEIALSDLWFDIDMNGIRDPGESVGEVAGLTLGGGRMVDVTDPVIRFDTADAAWLLAYTHFLSGFSELALAYDPAPAVDLVLDSSREIYALWGDTPPANAWDFMFGKQVDRVAMILNALAQEPDAARTARAHGHLLSMIAENRRFWTLVEAETDNDREWVPNERQVSGLGIVMPPGTGARWLDVLAEGESVLTGAALMPHWRYGAEAGINLARMFEDPPRVDLVGMIQGASLLPYAEKGALADGAAWAEFERLVRGDALLFAVFLN
ncbi:hypothetical protein [Pseudogemmobacter sonorensis]|uniref:hypothetical protein n=1 Tax=Pseudogemmobacter sonorensis TaxID=2989681 RepID=UPI0036C1590B